MAAIRLLFLWHMHQPYYKDLVTGAYRLPWVRLHALKDYYGMVKLLEEFPDVRMTFNLVPSLVAQIEDYAAGTANDPVLDLVSKPAQELTDEERRAALQYLFQANPVHLIGRYLRYRELFETHSENDFDAERSLKQFTTQDYTDLQVLSQLAWFDEFHLQEPAVMELVRKGRRYTDDDRAQMLALQKDRIAKVLPAYARAAKEGRVELSTSAYYHPILPLLCDTNAGAISMPGLRLPRHRYRHPEDAVVQMERAREKHKTTFGSLPVGLWPSEGSVSEEAILLAA